MGDAPRGYQSVFAPGLFDGKTAIVTGGGSGIGRCVAHELCHLGAFVVLVGRKEDKLNAVAAEIAEDGGRCAISAFDIRDEDAVKTAVQAIADTHGKIDLLVNNAGGQFPSNIEDISKKGWDAVIATNLTGGWLMMKAVFEASMKDYGGAIVSITADMHNGMPGMAHSGAARAGMNNLTQTAAFEWAKHGIRVNAVAPGIIASSGMDTYDGTVKAMIPYMKTHIPAQRLGSEAEVSSAICFLLSEGANFISGVQLNVDGAGPLGGRMWPLEAHENIEIYNGFHRAVAPEVLRGKDSV